MQQSVATLKFMDTIPCIQQNNLGCIHKVIINNILCCSFETSDGNKQDAQGTLKDAGSEHEGIVVHGSYSFVGDDGKTYTVTYVADENGFQPQGDHLPVAPHA